MRRRGKDGGVTTHDCDILVSGGGVAGLAASCLFGHAGFGVLCVDPAAPPGGDGAQGEDLRSTAFLQPALALFERAGLRGRLEPHAAALQTMRIVEAPIGADGRRLSRDFDAAEISAEPFGWNVPNAALKREMLARMGELGSVEFLSGVGVERVFTRDGEARIGLSDGSERRCRLAIAADGRNSPVREAVGIAVRTVRYGQKALAFCVVHDIPHGGVSTEIHCSGGPFTLVPLPDRGGRPCSAVVWMERGSEAKRLLDLPEDRFEAALDARSGGLFGSMKLASPRAMWPVVSQVAKRMSAERVALAGEAAHVVPPIGAQGLNMSLSDLRALLELAEESPGSLGDGRMLDAYHRVRHGQVLARCAAIDALNRVSMAGAAPLRRLRAAGLDMLHAAAPLRRGAMRLGLGAGG